MLNSHYRIRTVEHSDIDQLIELEKEWPENARASSELLIFRIHQFQQGYFIAEDESGIIASIISHPYFYQPNNLSYYPNWESVVATCYASNKPKLNTNALYIISGTSRKTCHGGEVFDNGVNHVVELAKKLGKQYIVAGCLLPSYARYLSKYEFISASDYVFKKTQGRFIDPLIEKYKRLQFYVPNPEHVIQDYYPHEASLNYSALVVRNLSVC